jgi:hypothetical protein
VESLVNERLSKNSIDLAYIMEFDRFDSYIVSVLAEALGIEYMILFYLELTLIIILPGEGHCASRSGISSTFGFFTFSGFLASCVSSLASPVRPVIA